MDYVAELISSQQGARCSDLLAARPWQGRGECCITAAAMPCMGPTTIIPLFTDCTGSNNGIALLGECCVQDSVTLQWQAPPDNGSGITFYKLEMDDGRGGDFEHVYGGQSDQLSAVVTGLQVGLIGGGAALTWQYNGPGCRSPQSALNTQPCSA